MDSQALHIKPVGLLDAMCYKKDGEDASAATTLKDINMKRVFVCSPYRDDDHVQVAQNEVYASKFCRFVLKHGAAPFCAHLFYPQFLNDEVCVDRDCGISCALVFLDACDEVWVFVPHERPWLTEGMKIEVLEATRLKKPLKFYYYSEV